MSIHIGHHIRRSVAVTLVVWLFGFGCLVGCELDVSAAPAVVGVQADGAESCPMNAGGHDCCQQATDTGDELSLKTLPHSTGKMACCPLLDEVADPARKILIAHTWPAALTDERLFSAAAALESNTFTRASVRVPDRGGTFLRICVFRI